tara:strand:+ start:286 stop:531 length:246 start_codon:yes stop_codon:yes gene_type:complete
MTKDQKMLSLYDYLNKPAGKELGGEVMKASKAHTTFIKIETKTVDSPAYKGKVCLYPKWFLDEYFNGKKTPSTVTEDDLPF